MTKNKKRIVTVVSIILVLAVYFGTFQLIPKLSGKVFLTTVVILLGKWVYDFIKHEENK